MGLFKQTPYALPFGFQLFCGPSSLIFQGNERGINQRGGLYGGYVRHRVAVTALRGSENFVNYQNTLDSFVSSGEETKMKIIFLTFSKRY